MTDVVEEEDDDGGYIELCVAFEPVAGQWNRDTDHFEFTWMTPEELLAIARDLVACDERGGDPRDVMMAWRCAREVTT